MVGDIEPNNQRPAEDRLAPPRLAQSLIGMLTTGADRAALIGDMEEEFFRQSRRSPNEARAWYWRQTAISAPHLALHRLHSEQFQRLGVAIAAILGAFVMIHYWDIFVARNAARSFAAMTEATSYLLPRGVYLLAQMAGIAVAGGVIAFLTFRSDYNFVRNAIRRLIPAAIVLFAPPVFAMLSPADNYDLNFRLLFLALALPSLFAGAWIAIKIKR